MKIKIPTEGEPDERGFYRIPDMTIYPNGKIIYHDDGRTEEVHDYKARLIDSLKASWRRRFHHD